MDYLPEYPLVCRVCLKIVEYRAQSFGYIEDANGNLRDMMMCCVPEMDIYVSTDPVICFSCIQHLINVYNFKTRCINTETIIRSYMQRNHLSECNKVSLSCVVQDLMRINQFHKEQEERRKMLIKSEIYDHQRFGVEDLPTGPSTENVLNSVPSQITPPLGGTMHPFSIPAPINNVPQYAQSIANISTPHISPSYFRMPQQSSQNLQYSYPRLTDSLLSSPPAQQLTFVAVPIDHRGPIPPPTGLLPIQGNIESPLVLLTPSIKNTHQNNTLPQKVPSTTPPPLHFLAHSQTSSLLPQSEGNFSIQKEQPTVPEIVRTDPDITSKSVEHPFVHPIESKMRLVIRIPRSKITVPCERNEEEDDTDNENKDDCNDEYKNEDSSKMENGIEDVEMIGNDWKSRAFLDDCEDCQVEAQAETWQHRVQECAVPTSLSNALEEELNTYKVSNIPVEKSISKIYNCTCMYLTTSEALFSEHKKVCKNNVKNFLKCPHCPHVTSRSHALNKHINTMHTKAVWFICEYCTYRSTDKSCLRRHVRKHHQENANTGFVCQICGYTCSTEFNLSKHMTKHEPSHLINCEFCPYTSKDRSNFRKHIFTHSVKQLNCEFCSYQNVSPYQMRLHLKKFHDGVGLEDIDCKSERPVSEIINDIKADLEEQQEKNVE